MTPPVALVENAIDELTEPCNARPVKRLKSTADVISLPRESENSTLAWRHPLGVRPSGNALTSTSNLKAACGFFSILPDELLVVITERLNARDLLNLGGACRALHAFSRNEELWRTLFIESAPYDFTWRGSWRSTYLSQPLWKEPVVDCSCLSSDALHRPFFCAHTAFQPFVEDIPEQNHIARLDNLSNEDFEADWVDTPFILTNPVKEWPIYKTWDKDVLLEKYADTQFRAEAVDWPLRTYVDYMNSNEDESPLYLFDCRFVEKMALSVATKPEPDADYWPPPCFGSDLFSVLGAQRPDHRWLIVGPARSGSTFHKDPNATSAWNAVLRGSKYWIMFPSSSRLPPPPGVYVSKDHSEVTSPLSIAEWLIGFHAQARQTPGCKEGICGQGEVLYVPSGWYHLVLNLEPSIAVTQNFVPKARVGAVLHFLREQKQSISGFGNDVKDPYQLFVERLASRYPTVLEEGLQTLDKISHQNRGAWEEIVKSEMDKDDEASGFTFGFASDGDAAESP